MHEAHVPLLDDWHNRNCQIHYENGRSLSSSFILDFFLVGRLLSSAGFERKLVWPLREHVRYRADDLRIQTTAGTDRQPDALRDRSMLSDLWANDRPKIIRPRQRCTEAGPDEMMRRYPRSLKRRCRACCHPKDGGSTSGGGRKWNGTTRCAEGLFQKLFECRCHIAVK